MKLSSLFGFVAGHIDCNPSTLDTERRSASDLPPDDDTGSDVSIKHDEELTTAECEADIMEEERCAAMLAAMDVHSPHGLQQTGQAMSVEACLARFTDKETLSGANMITCDMCSRTAAEAAACNGNDDNNNAKASNGDHPSSSKTSCSGVFDFIVYSVRQKNPQCTSKKSP